MLQDEIATAVAVAMGPAMADAELRRAIRKPPAQLDAWEAHQRGLWHWAKGGEIEDAQARAFFQRAIELDPSVCIATCDIGLRVPLGGLPRGRTNFPGTCCGSRVTEARLAVELDPDNAEALALRSWVSFYQNKLNVALEQADCAIAINHNDGGAYVAKGNALLHSQRTAAAREPFMMAIRLNPRDTFGAIASIYLRRLPLL